MGATHFLTKTMPRVSTEMSLHVLAYNLKRAMQILGIAPLVKAISACRQCEPLGFHTASTRNCLS
jgi:hypothetical protein